MSETFGYAYNTIVVMNEDGELLPAPRWLDPYDGEPVRVTPRELCRELGVRDLAEASGFGAWRAGFQHVDDSTAIAVCCADYAQRRGVCGAILTLETP